MTINDLILDFEKSQAESNLDKLSMPLFLVYRAASNRLTSAILKVPSDKTLTWVKGGGKGRWYSLIDSARGEVLIWVDASMPIPAESIEVE